MSDEKNELSEWELSGAGKAAAGRRGRRVQRSGICFWIFAVAGCCGGKSVVGDWVSGAATAV